MKRILFFIVVLTTIFSCEKSDKDQIEVEEIPSDIIEKNIKEIKWTKVEAFYDDYMSSDLIYYNDKIYFMDYKPKEHEKFMYYDITNDNWNNRKLPFKVTSKIKPYVYNNEIYLFHKNDGKIIIHKGDGDSWVKLNTNIPERSSFEIVEFKRKLWLMGGLGYNENGQTPVEKYPSLSDVWCSTDGEDWKLVTENGLGGRRYDFALLALNNKMYVNGTRRVLNENNLESGYYFSEDGINWLSSKVSGSVDKLIDNDYVTDCFFSWRGLMWYFDIGGKIHISKDGSVFTKIGKYPANNSKHHKVIGGKSKLFYYGGLPYGPGQEFKKDLYIGDIVYE